VGIAWRLSLKPVLLSTTPGPSRNFEAGNVEIRSDNSLMGNVATRRIFIEQGAVVSGVIDPAMRPRGLLEAGGVEVAIPLKFFRAESETQRKPTPIQVRYGSENPRCGTLQIHPATI
jgi:hypothetical protein